MKPFKIAVIPGDGIGVEVLDRGAQGGPGGGSLTRHHRLRPRRPALPGNRRGAARPGARRAAQLRRHPARRGRYPRGTARGARAGPAVAAAVRAGSLHQPAALRGVAQRRGRRSHRLRGDPGEHRRDLCWGGWIPAQGHAGGDRHPGFGQHPVRGGALRPLCLRSGPVATGPASDAGAQDQRADLRRRPVAAHLRPGGHRVPRRRDRLSTTSTRPASTASSPHSVTTSS